MPAICTVTPPQWRVAAATSNAAHRTYPPCEAAFLLACCDYVELNCPSTCGCRSTLLGSARCRNGDGRCWVVKPDCDFWLFSYHYGQLWARGSQQFGTGQPHTIATSFGAHWGKGIELLHRIHTQPDFPGIWTAITRRANTFRRTILCTDARQEVLAVRDRLFPRAIGSVVYPSKFLSTLYYDIVVAHDTASKVKLNRSRQHDPGCQANGGYRAWDLGQDMHQCLIRHLDTHGVTLTDVAGYDDAPRNHWRSEDVARLAAAHGGLLPRSPITRPLDKVFY